MYVPFCTALLSSLMCYLRGLLQPLLSSRYGMDDETVLLCYLVTIGELLCYGLIFPRQHLLRVLHVFHGFNFF